MDNRSPQESMPSPLELGIALRRVLGSGAIDCDTSTCPEVLRMIDEYAERMYRGEDISEYMPVVKEHLQECPECCEECEALLRILGLEDP